MLQSTMGLYAGLQAFFAAHPALQRRPFFVAGESYAGKFVPLLGASPQCRAPHTHSGFFGARWNACEATQVARSCAQL